MSGTRKYHRQFSSDLRQGATGTPQLDAELRLGESPKHSFGASSILSNCVTVVSRSAKNMSAKILMLAVKQTHRHHTPELTISS